MKTMKTMKTISTLNYDIKKNKVYTKIFKKYDNDILAEDEVAELGEDIKEFILPCTASWDYKGFKNKSNFHGNQKEWNATFIKSVSQLSNVHMYRSGKKINIIFVSSEILSIIRDSEYFREFNEEEKKELNSLKTQKIMGIIGETYKVVLDNNMQKNLSYGMYMKQIKEFNSKKEYSALFIYNI